MDLLTAPYVFTADEARAMAEAGADVLVPHMGLTTKGIDRRRRRHDLERAVEQVQAMHDAAAAESTRHPVPLPRRPDRRARGRRRSSATTRGVVGFFGASSIERLPTEVAMTENMQRFKAIPIEEGT